jgi:hypothetical protein
MVTIGLRYFNIPINSQDIVINAKKLSGKNIFLPDFPFSKWGLDFIGPINPLSSAGHIFILIATYYFTKWIEVVPLKHT